MSSAAPALRGRAPLGLLGAARRGFALFLFGALPLTILALLAHSFATGFHTFDFHTFWQSGRDVLHGRSPYPRSLPQVADRHTFRPFVYPAPAAVAMAPFALLPLAAADVLFALGNVAALAGALRLLGVRDRRCYGAVFASIPVVAAIGNGTITPLLVLGAAALWRRRDSAWAAGALLAALVAAKLFLWPLGVWLLATRRLRATASSVAICLGGTLGAWAILGFAGLRTYPSLLGRLTDLVGPQSYSLYALAVSLGASSAAAQAAVYGAGALVLAGVFPLARRRGGDRRAFTLALAAALVLSPVVWPHYLALLFVPLALARPQLDRLWAAPLALWLVTADWSYGDPKRIVPVLALAGAVLYATAASPSRRLR